MQFRRALGLFDATMVVIGGIIGAGIFINPYIVAQRLPSSAWVLAAWAAGGAIALTGALAYAELGSLFPKAGGQYVYLRDAYHPLVGFLYGWALLLLIECGAIAAVAITFAEYALRLVGRGDASALPLAIAAIVVVSAINYLGVKPGSRVLNVLVVLKVAALAILIGAGFLLTPAVDGPLGAQTSVSAGTASEPTGPILLLFGAALIPIVYAVSSKWVANSWDRMVVPLPFARVVARRLPARFVPRDLDDAGAEALRRTIEEELTREQARIEAEHAGQPTPLIGRTGDT